MEKVACDIGRKREGIVHVKNNIAPGVVASLPLPADVKPAPENQWVLPHHTHPLPSGPLVATLPLAFQAMCPIPVWMW